MELDDYIKNKNDIAIIGMSCRFPGAKNIDEFWLNLQMGKTSIQDVPQERWDCDTYRFDNSQVDRKSVNRSGGFIHDVKQFDAEFFGISDKEACYMDPQQRMLMEVAWETFEHAGINPNELAGSNTGVFIGSCNHDFSVLLWPQTDNLYAATGTSNGVAANRISYTYKLNGPSISVDTACSSSLTAVHLACQSIRHEECDLALVGGSSVLLLPTVGASLCRAGMISANGSCQPFSEAADGYIRSEGAGMIALKPLSAAIQNDNNILAVISGSAINHNGETNGLTAPSTNAQLSLLKTVYKQANIDACDVSYLEAAATGTKLGDAIEMKSILDFYIKKRRSNHSALCIGSLKISLGHLEGVGGIAAVIKTALSIYNESIPVGYTDTEVSSLINIKNKPVYFSKQSDKWPVKKNQNKIAGISSFGFGGSNAHVILKNYPKKELCSSSIQNKVEQFILPISAKSDTALHDLYKLYYEQLKTDTTIELASHCYNAAIRRTHFKKRNALIFDNIAQLKKQLSALVEDVNPNQSMSGLNSGVIYLSGNLQAYEAVELNYVYRKNNHFKDIVDNFDAQYSEVTGKSLISLLFSNSNDDLNTAKVSALVREICIANWLFESIPEIKTVIVSGLGELAMLVAKGVLPIIDVIALVRGEAIDIDISHHKRLKIPVYYIDKPLLDNHNRLIQAPWRNCFKSAYKTGQKAYKNSCLIAAVLNKDDETLSVLVREFEDKVFFVSQFKSASEFYQNIYNSGLNVNWKKYYIDQSYPYCPLPSYPFNRKYLWPDELNNKQPEVADNTNLLAEKLIDSLKGKRISLPFSNEERYEYFLEPNSSNLLSEHMVSDQYWVSMATQILMCISNCMEGGSYKSLKLENISLPSQLILRENMPTPVQVIISKDDRYKGSFQLVAGEFPADYECRWQTTLTASYEFISETTFAAKEGTQLPSLSDNNLSDIENKRFYSELEHRGYRLGRHYQWLSAPCEPEHSAAQLIRRPENLNNPYGLIHPGLLNACLLAVGIHINSKEKTDIIAMPTHIDELNINLPSNDISECVMFCVAHQAEDNVRHADVQLQNRNGSLILRMSGINIKLLSDKDLRKLCLSQSVFADNNFTQGRDYILGSYIHMDSISKQDLYQPVRKLISEILGRKIDSKSILKPLNILGFDSLKTMELRSILYKECSFELSLVKVLSGMTGDELIELLTEYLNMNKSGLSVHSTRTKNKRVETEIINFSDIHFKNEMVEVEL